MCVCQSLLPYAAGMCNILSNLIHSFLRNRSPTRQQQERVVPLKTGLLQILDIMLCFVALCGKTETLLSTSIRPTSFTHGYIMHFLWRQTWTIDNTEQKTWKKYLSLFFTLIEFNFAYSKGIFSFQKSSLFI